MTFTLFLKDVKQNIDFHRFFGVLMPFPLIFIRFSVHQCIFPLIIIRFLVH